jgi:hypothetical protein
VLKDTWIDSDRTREGNSLASLYEAADGEDKQLIEKFFLTTISHGDVWTELDILDDTANGLMRGLHIAPDHDSLFKFRDVYSRQRYIHKTHYRIVFKEIGITIDRMPSLPGVMAVFTETVGGAF